MNGVGNPLINPLGVTLREQAIVLLKATRSHHEPEHTGTQPIQLK